MKKLVLVFIFSLITANAQAWNLPGTPWHLRHPQRLLRRRNTCCRESNNYNREFNNYNFNYRPSYREVNCYCKNCPFEEFTIIAPNRLSYMTNEELCRMIENDLIMKIAEI